MPWLRRGRATDWGCRRRSILIHSGARTPSFSPWATIGWGACYVRSERPIRRVCMYVAASVEGEAVGNSWSPWEKRTNKFSLTLCLKEWNGSSVFSPLEKPLHIFFRCSNPHVLKMYFLSQETVTHIRFKIRVSETQRRKQRMCFSALEKKEMAQVLFATWKNRYAYVFRWLEPTTS